MAGIEATATKAFDRMGDQFPLAFGANGLSAVNLFLQTELHDLRRDQRALGLRDRIQDSPFVGAVAKKPALASLVETVTQRRPRSDFSWHVDRFVQGKGPVTEIEVYGSRRYAGSFALHSGVEDGKWFRSQTRYLQRIRQEVRQHSIVLAAPDKAAAVNKMGDSAASRFAHAFHDKHYHDRPLLDRVFPGYNETVGQAASHRYGYDYSNGGWKQVNFIRDQLKAGKAQFTAADSGIIAAASNEAKRCSRLELKEERIPMRSALKELRRQFPTGPKTVQAGPANTTSTPVPASSKATSSPEVVNATPKPVSASRKPTIGLEGATIGIISVLGVASNAWAAKAAYDRGNYLTASLYGVGAGASAMTAFATFTGRSSRVGAGAALAGSLAGTAATIASGLSD